ncbi:MAG: CRISPR-associated helicase Cas3', partial [Pseudanabaenaceae cyanobacterium]
MTVKFKTLLAKSIGADGEYGSATYTGHIFHVCQAARILVKTLKPAILQQLDWPAEDFERFARTVEMGAYLHDWGKANQHFQEMVRVNSRAWMRRHESDWVDAVQSSWKSHQGKQMLRHEVLSGILALRVPAFRSWLSSRSEVNLVVAVWAAMGHHLKLRGELAIVPDATGRELSVYTKHPHFKSVLSLGVKFLALPAILPECDRELWSRGDIEVEAKALQEEFDHIDETMDASERSFAAAVKALVIAADLAGSALPVEGENIKDWIQQVLEVTLSETDLQGAIAARLGEQPLRPFQRQIASATHRITLVQAGCGSGKTIGAYAWAQERGQGRKLFFCYPTTGTASQGFLDYAAFTNFECTLMHSRADLDRELLFSGETDDSEGMDARLSSLRAWRNKLIVCTVDTVLGLVQNNRKSLYSFPALLQAIFVFDEVHAYDSELFGALLRFLAAFPGAPVLLMSASFSPKQIEAISQTAATMGEEIGIVRGAAALESLLRYRLCYLPEPAVPLDRIWAAVADALTMGQKVLWVTNTVSSCINLYRAGRDRFCEVPSGAEVLIYHSRFRYKDRLRKHALIVNGFKSDRPILAFTTQVCEMSLDLSADLLITAMAPAAALIQRMGRLNRRIIEATDGSVHLASGAIQTAMIYPWPEDHPYKKEELGTGEKLVAALADRPSISQTDLAEE